MYSDKIKMKVFHLNNLCDMELCRVSLLECEDCREDLNFLFRRSLRRCFIEKGVLKFLENLHLSESFFNKVVGHSLLDFSAAVINHFFAI